MRRRLAWVIVLLVVAALAVPAAAAPRVAGTGSVYGTIYDSATGLPFDLSGGGMIGIDVFNLSTMARTVVWVSGTAAASYEIDGLSAGQYKMRFRYWDETDGLAGYRWYPNAGNFDAATPFTILAGAALKKNTTIRPMAGAGVSGTVVERGSGTPLTGCHNINVYEASGISLGWISDTDAAGVWSFPAIPAGQYTVLAYTVSNPAVTGCEGPPAHMDTWYRGASGWPLGGMVAHEATFATARMFKVVAGVDVTGITIQMLPAPTCRGKTPTIYGTTLNDTINGTAARDIISGLAGDDIINGKAGGDLLCGDTGNDELTGGLGIDTAVGGAGTDACNADNPIGCEILP